MILGDQPLPGDSRTKPLGKMGMEEIRMPASHENMFTASTTRLSRSNDMREPWNIRYTAISAMSANNADSGRRKRII